MIEIKGGNYMWQIFYDLSINDTNYRILSEFFFGLTNVDVTTNLFKHLLIRVGSTSYSIFSI